MINQLTKCFSFYCLILVLTSCSSGLPLKDQKTSQQWFQQGEDQVQERKQKLIAQKQDFNRQLANGKKAKNIILVVGDGMGVSTLTAARIFVGQQQGLMGEEFALSFERFPQAALVKTYNVDLQTPDSAGTMSAMMTGVKTNEGIISLPHTVQRADCQPNLVMPTLIDLAKAKGKSTAMITTARITHATPATSYAHSSDRNWESDHAMPEEAKAKGCLDIASQLVLAQDKPLDVIFGGGRRHFLPENMGGKRKDQKNLITSWQQEGRYVESQEQLLSLAKDEDYSQPWLGLFAHSHMAYAYQRPKQQPSLQQMTQVALQRLATNEEGYAMVIEAGRIDHGHHEGRAYKALTETQELHETVAWLLTQVNLEETLIVVTADHSHTLTLSGYSTRGNPILGKVVENDRFGYPKSSASLDDDWQTYTALSYRDGPGALYFLQQEDQAEKGHETKDEFHPEYQQQALVPMDYETHGGEDVALYAVGPMALLFSGTLEQHWIFHALKYAM
jgi:alkaline phosphatase